MGWKEFLKPDIFKIIITIILFLIPAYYYPIVCISCPGCGCVGFLPTLFQDPFIAIISFFLNPPLLLILLSSYLISCLIDEIYLKKKK